MSTPIFPTLKAHEQNNNKFNPKRLTLVFVSVMLAIVSCSKKDVCENCNQNNAWPIAKAGIDTIIVSPTDSILLNGSSSSDPDGNISTYNWSEVPSFHAGSVPAIRNNIEKQTVVTNLRPGIYRFSLKVTDNKGAHSVDTVNPSGGVLSIALFRAVLEYYSNRNYGYRTSSRLAICRFSRR